jgi:hypothetical protein
MKIYHAEIQTSSQSFQIYFTYEPTPNNALEAIESIVSDLQVSDIFPLLGNPNEIEPETLTEASTAMLLNALERPTKTFSYDLSVLTPDGHTVVPAETEITMINCFSILADVSDDYN